MKKLALRYLLVLSTLFPAFSHIKADIIWYDGTNPVSYSVKTQLPPVGSSALSMFAEDIEMVTGLKPIATDNSEAHIEITCLENASDECANILKGCGIPVDSLLAGTDAFAVKAHDGKILVVGSNGRGTAYGILELSRLAGVNPWVWWGDLVPVQRNILTLQDDYSTVQSASVEIRGVFINDEDWSMRPWSNGNFEPNPKGSIGPESYRKLFELLLRLRANAMWPAMHPGTEAFFKNPRNKEIADSFGIIIGTSHCEPLLRNNVGEWDVNERGAFNYMTNRDKVHEYWCERLEEVNGSKDNMFTIGMRGIHDGSMEGVRTMEEKFNALQEVIDNQQQLLAEHIGDPSSLIQVFVPYKEVLDIYKRGLQVPEYVTLMWCDDNYGYITRLSDECERMRSGGAGLYYHLSYWGRPHDYLWLTTTQPGLIYNQLRNAYEHNVRRIWIANVHDPKVAGYDLELFLDLAWNIDCAGSNGPAEHYRNWLCRQFGTDVGEALFPAMHEFYRLTGMRRPEFMGWNQTELDKRVYNRGISPVTDTGFSLSTFGDELDRYLERYDSICHTVNSLSNIVRPELADAYFAAVEYPVNCARLQAVKMLEAQRARSLYRTDSISVNSHEGGNAVHPSILSLAAHNDIQELTQRYNNLNDGKWRLSMCCAPRELPTFAEPSLPYAPTAEEIANASYDYKSNLHQLIADSVIARNANDFDSSTFPATGITMLGHSMMAVPIPAGESLVYRFNTIEPAEVLLRCALIPTQPVDDGELRFSVSIDNAEPAEFSLKEPFRSEPWKQNVLRCQALREMHSQLEAGEHTLEIKAIDPNIILDQWMIDLNPGRAGYYLFPIED